jgi:hypothetical protein
MVFSVMMVIKGMSYALNNPTKEILYQVITIDKVHFDFPSLVICLCTLKKFMFLSNDTYLFGGHFQIFYELKL